MQDVLQHTTAQSHGVPIAAGTHTTHATAPSTTRDAHLWHTDNDRGEWLPHHPARL